MTSFLTVPRSLIAIAVLCGVAWLPFGGPSAPEEGMWTFDNLPLKALKEKYGFEPTQEWIDHVRLSSIKFASDEGGGGSASFVSSNGLLMTNHHVAMETLQLLYNRHKDYDYVAHGFSAKEYGQEVKAPGFKLRQLLEIKDVTKEVADLLKDAPEAERAKKRAEIMKEKAGALTDASKRMYAEPVALYQGSVQQIYVYRIFDDIRLVWAPEKQVAFYGGDFDNFTYPRYCLDAAFFRVYENDKPVDSSKFHFKWSSKGADKGDLVFVPGNPGTTNRLMTYAELEVQRDVIAPATIRFIRDRLADIDRQMKANPENALTMRDEYFGMANALKAWEGQERGLKDAVMMAKMKAAEEELIAKSGDAEELVAAFDQVRATTEYMKLLPRLRYYRLPGLVARPNSPPTTVERFLSAVNDGSESFDGDVEFASGAEKSLLSQLETAAKGLPEDDPFRKIVLSNRTPEATVASFKTSKLFDKEYRAALLKGGKDALAKADDALVVAVRDVKKLVDDVMTNRREGDALKASAYEKIAAARFKVYGTSIYPDATFTLRLSYGTCKGYEAGQTMVPWKTTFTGLFERNTSFDNEAPFDLPKRWTEARSKVALETPYNFVCTTDIIGGNSGSPIINRDAEVVGLVFDGNIESLSGAYWFDEATNRTVAVHTAAITEALKAVYGEAELVKELVGG
jgi:hypothetical protein